MATLLDGTEFNSVRVVNCASATNTIVGKLAAYALTPAPYVNNTFFGCETACNLVCGNRNSAMGFQALTAGGGAGVIYINDSIAIGAQAMWTSQTSYRNIAIGTYAMQNHQGGNDNVAIGYQAGKQLNNGNKNVLVGSYAGACIGNGEKNVGIGKNALLNIGPGNGNIALGAAANYNINNGNYNISIGYKSGNNVSSANYTISIGAYATTSNNNGHTIAGNAAVTVHQVGAVAWAVISDSRDKADITQLDDNLGLNFIRNLRPVKFNFDFRQNYVDKCQFEFGTKDGTLVQEKESYGFIAQEMEETLENLNVEFQGLKSTDNKSKYRLTYDNLIAPIVKSLQDTIKRLEYLESKV